MQLFETKRFWKRNWAKFEKFWWRTIAMKKWKCFGINKNKSSELELFGANWLIILLWMQRLQRTDKYPGAKHNSIETFSNGVQTYLFEMKYAEYNEFECEHAERSNHIDSSDIGILQLFEFQL